MGPPNGAVIDKTIVPLHSIAPVTFAARIAGSNTGLIAPTALARSPGGDLYVVEGTAPRIDVFDANANGNVAPKASIAGNATGITSTTTSIAFDGTGALYVATYAPVPGTSPQAYDAKILRFAPGATGDVAPVATIAGDRTTLLQPSAIAIDAGFNIYVGDVSRGSSETAGTTDIAVFAPLAAGNVAPVTTIATSLVPPLGGSVVQSTIGFPPRLVASGSVLYGTSPAEAGNTSAAVVEFGIGSGPGAAIDAIPLRGIALGAQSAPIPIGLALDAAHDIVVADAGDRQILFFDPLANGTTAAFARFTGPFQQSFTSPTAVTF